MRVDPPYHSPTSTCSRSIRFPVRMSSAALRFVWRDGKVVRARTAAEVGKAYIEGRLTPEQLEELVSSIEQNGILKTRPDESSPMHAANDTLKIWTQGGQRACEFRPEQGECPGEAD